MSTKTTTPGTASAPTIGPVGTMERICCVAMMGVCDHVVTLLSGLGEEIDKAAAETGDRMTATSFEGSAEALRTMLRRVAENLAIADWRPSDDGASEPVTSTERAVFLRGLRSSLEEEPDAGQWLLTRGQVLAMLTIIDETTE